jgi:DNA primase catalytic core
MARIPEHEVNRLKAEVSVERLAEARGIKLERRGADLVGLCPFHEDHSPSLVITPGKNLWHCLGCGKGGSVIDWVMKSKGISLRHALELLRANHSSLAAPGPVVRSRGTAAAVKLDAPFKIDADDQSALNQVVDYYHQTLKQSPEALKYLQARGLEHPEMIGHFRIGFSNRTLCYRLPESNRKEGAEIRGRLQRLGIIRESGHEHFTGSVVIPVIDLDGNVTEIYGRKITEGLRAGTPLHTYLAGPHKGVWNEEAPAVSKEIILCESLIDALTFWCADYRNVTASYGVNGFTEDHRQAFKKHGIKKVLIAYDRDEAGEKAAYELAGELISMGIDCYRVLFPKGMDANEYACKVKPATKSLGVLLNKVEWLGKGNAPSVAVKETIENTPEPQAAKEKIPETPSLAAEPVVEPPPIVIDSPVEIRGDEITITQGDRRYRIRGLAKNLSQDILRVNVLAMRGDALHVDTLDMNVDRQRVLFSKRAAEELDVKEDVIRKDLGRLFFQLETLRNDLIQKALNGKEEGVQLSPEEKAAALELLKDPNLMDRILEDFARCGIVGEETNKKVTYLAAVSRLLDAPLAIILQSSSAAGKSSLMEAVLALMPEEQRVQYSAMTGQSLFYMGETDLKNKILAIVEEEGAQRAAYALKLLQSEAVLTIASTGKDPATGKLITHQYRVEGPVMIFLTTTAIEIDEELLNRCLVLTVDEDREQTRAIHRMQREAQTLEGILMKRRRQEIVALHRNAQRLLKPLSVVNPYAQQLTFPDGLTRTRRDHMKFLALIRAITLLHQYQRPVKTVSCGNKTLEYIESTPEDIRLAEDLIKQVLGRSLDELPPQTRRLLLTVDEMVTKECERLQMDRTDYRFSRRDVRHYTGWSDGQLKRHLHKLEELEYLIVHRGGRGQSMVYELYFERPADLSEPFLPGLIDVEKLRTCGYDPKKSEPKAEMSGPSLPQVTGVFGGGTGEPEPIKTGLRRRFGRFNEKNTDTGLSEKEPVVIVAAGAR